MNETTVLELDESELDTIEAIARNEQSGRITKWEIRELVRRYRASKLLTVEAVEKAMQDSWNDICTDTNCHPLDITQLGRRRLTFHPDHWARLTAENLRNAMADGGSNS